ncbi:MAG: DUF2231 domain-containing protein [Phycisphaerales bacterium]|nr:DUF2231 domain-containing protein [Phycisphaerales bacterium]
MRTDLQIGASQAPTRIPSSAFSTAPTISATLLFVMRGWLLFSHGAVLAQEHQHGGADKLAETATQAGSEAVEGTLVDAMWFFDEAKEDKVARAAKRLADGGPAALLPAGRQQPQDLLYLLTNPAVLAPYAGATVKVEGQLLAEIRAVRPTGLYVRDDGKWREVQLKADEQKSAAEPQLGAASAPAHERPPSRGAEERADAAHHEGSPASRPGEHEHGEGEPSGHAHEHWIELPPAHPLLVNFTAGLFPAAVLADWLGRWRRRQSLRAAAWWMLLFAAVISPFTALAGWLWYREVGDMGHWQMPVHKWVGLSLAIALIPLAVWRGRLHILGKEPSLRFLIVATAVLAVMVVQGHLGATMSFEPSHDASQPAQHAH